MPAILGQRVARHPAASVARTFMWVFASIDLVGWFVMCLGLVLASSIGLESFARPEAGFFLCFVGLMTIFVSTIFVHGRSANSAVTRLVLPPRQ
ncbi:MAG TPA: hypothetical protein VMF65_02070 [Acidimicrobiales bacterium]|nr:hypothetical protein [Acidimicrobiales bacterium]